MLIANLSDDLVNGLVGTVEEIRQDVIYVDFTVKGKGVLVPIKRDFFHQVWLG